MQAEKQDRFASLMSGKTDGKIVSVKLTSIIESEDSRVDSYNEDRVNEFAGIFKDNEKSLPAIYLEILPDGTYALLDGRHRRRGALRAGIEQVRCLLFKDLTEEDRTILALVPNMTIGPLTMSNPDIMFNMKKLALPLANGGPGKTIAEIKKLLANHVTPSRLKKLLNVLSADLDNRRMRQALLDYEAGIDKKTVCEKNAVDEKTFARALAKSQDPSFTEAEDTAVDLLRMAGGTAGFAFHQINKSIDKAHQQFKKAYATTFVRTASGEAFYAKIENDAKALLEKATAMHVKFGKVARTH